jgi:hypothetical protein
MMAKNILLALIAMGVIAGGAIYFAKKRPQPISIEEGIPIYPGASTNTDSFAVRLSPADRARLVKAVTYRTDDPSAKVIAFYKEKLAGKTQVLEQGRRGIPSAVFRTEVSGKPKLIMISSNEDTNKTEIIISTIAPPPVK